MLYFCVINIIKHANFLQNIKGYFRNPDSYTYTLLLRWFILDMYW
jgi:hypothetical protein